MAQKYIRDYESCNWCAHLILFLAWMVRNSGSEWCINCAMLQTVFSDPRERGGCMKCISYVRFNHFGCDQIFTVISLLYLTAGVFSVSQKCMKRMLNYFCLSQSRICIASILGRHLSIFLYFKTLRLYFVSMQHFQFYFCNQLQEHYIIFIPCVLHSYWSSRNHGNDMKTWALQITGDLQRPSLH